MRLKKILEFIRDDFKKRVCNERGTWAAIAGTIGTTAVLGGAGYLGYKGLKGDKGKQAEPGGWNWLQSPQYSFTEPRYRLASDVMMQEMERMQAGELPQWYSGISPILRREMKESMLPQVQAYDVARGRGRGGAAGQRYAEQVRAIDEYIAKLGYGAQRETMGMLPSFATGVPAGPTGQWGAYGSSPYQPTGMEQMMGAFGQVAPWMMMGQMGRQQPTTTTMLPSWMQGGDVWAGTGYQPGQGLRWPATTTPF